MILLRIVILTIESIFIINLFNKLLVQLELKQGAASNSPLISPQLYYLALGASAPSNRYPAERTIMEQQKKSRAALY